jgi:hypothetical protein
MFLPLEGTPGGATPGALQAALPVKLLGVPEVSVSKMDTLQGYPEFLLAK